LGKIGEPFEINPNKTDSQGKVHNMEGKISKVMRINDQTIHKKFITN
jgi:hypothetical protein